MNTSDKQIHLQKKQHKTYSKGFSKHKSAHTSENPYPCDICEKTFKFLGNMKVHKK